jgi:hypothetical protein
MDSNTFSSWTRNCWMLFISVHAYEKEKKM